MDHDHHRVVGPLCSLADGIDRSCQRANETAGFDQLEPRDEQHASGGESRRMGNQSIERGFNPAEVPHHAKDKVLTSRPFRPTQGSAERLQQLIDALASFKPARHQTRGGRPRSWTTGDGFITHGGRFRHTV